MVKYKDFIKIYRTGLAETHTAVIGITIRLLVRLRHLCGQRYYTGCKDILLKSFILYVQMHFTDLGTVTSRYRTY